MSKGHIRRRGKGSWEVVIELPRSADGQRRQRSKTITGKRSEAQEYLIDELARLQGGASVANSRITLGKYLDQWLERHRETLSPTTAEGYRIIIDAHVKRTWREKLDDPDASPTALGDIRLQDLAWEHIEDYYDAYREQYQRDEAGAFVYDKAGERLLVRSRKLSEQTLKNHHRLIRKALKDAVKVQAIARNPADFARSPSPKGRKQVEAFNSTSNRDLVDRFEGNMQTFVRLLLGTGMRRGEALGLKWDVIRGGELHVCRSLVVAGKSVVLREDVKTSTSNRKITLPDAILADLKRHRARQSEKKLYAGEAYQDAGFVFANDLGERWHPTTITHQFKDGIRGSKFQSLDLHSLRHCHASQLIAAGINIKTISERLGHSTITITLDTYGHLLPGMDSAAANAINDSL